MLKAMGQITELIGKRSATVTGETMVEVQSGTQQLRTAYSKTEASHSQTDGDVTRDEVPVSLQPYVQRYFAKFVSRPRPDPRLQSNSAAEHLEHRGHRLTI